MRRLAAITGFLIVAAGTAAAQTPAATPAVCSYEDCALRVEPRLFGAPAILRGNAAAPVGIIGLFSDDLSRAVSDNEIAYGYARTAEKTQGTAVGLTLVGVALAVYGSVSFATNETVDVFGGTRRSDTGAAVAYVAGLGLGVAGGVIQVRSSQARSRAVWEYNRGLAARD